MDSRVARTAVETLVAGQTLAVLATEGSGWPYANLVAFAATPDLSGVLFATPRPTRKYRNISGNRRVALLVDSRTHRASDFQEAQAATARGVAEELGGDDREAGLRLYTARHPHLAEFVGAADCALFRVRVEAWHVVSRFQEVGEYRPPPPEGC